MNRILGLVALLGSIGCNEHIAGNTGGIDAGASGTGGVGGVGGFGGIGGIGGTGGIGGIPSGNGGVGGTGGDETHAGTDSGVTCLAGQAGPNCDACTPGQYCTGGDAPAVPCADGTWDNDSDAATGCVAQTDCVAGEFIAVSGTTTTDRDCDSCAARSFSTASNATACTAFTVCGPGNFISTDGSATTDQSCSACADGFYSNIDNANTCVNDADAGAPFP